MTIMIIPGLRVIGSESRVSRHGGRPDSVTGPNAFTEPESRAESRPTRSHWHEYTFVQVRRGAAAASGPARANLNILSPPVPGDLESTEVNNLRLSGFKFKFRPVTPMASGQRGLRDERPNQAEWDHFSLPV